MPPRRVVLVGGMGAGKSTVGPLLAHRLGWRFVDLDARIEECAGRSVAEVFRLEGEAGFREREATCTLELAGAERLVLAPGGGWVADARNPERLGPGSLLVWLRVSAEEALRRLRGQAAGRPLLDAPDPAAVLARLLAEREAMYTRAGLHVDTTGLAPIEVARRIEGHLRPRPGAAAGPESQE